MRCGNCLPSTRLKSAQQQQQINGGTTVPNTPQNAGEMSSEGMEMSENSSTASSRDETAAHFEPWTKPLIPKSCVQFPAEDAERPRGLKRWHKYHPSQMPCKKKMMTMPSDVSISKPTVENISKPNAGSQVSRQ